MYDIEDNFDEGGYSTPVPELDDHRHQNASVQREPRSRRGTADTLYRTTHMPNLNLVDQALLHTNTVVKDFESAIAEDTSRGASPIIQPMVPKGRRATLESLPGGISPPSSVKAFAQARRPSVFSNASGRSRRSRRVIDKDNKSICSSIKSEAEEDVCFPQGDPDDKRDKRKLYIDYDLLERFVAEEERDYTHPINQPQPKIFKDLRPGHIVTANVPTILNEHGQVIEVPSSDSSLKAKTHEQELDEKFGHNSAVQHIADTNRFSFFSSAWESTIHAAEFGDLIMDGENIRGLFEQPEGETDGVWWLNMNNPTEEEIRAICRAFGVHPLTIEDIEKQETREKIELFPSYYFACFRSFQIVEEAEGREYEPLNVYVIVFREGTLSFSFAPNSHAAQVRKRITALKDYVALSSDWICYALIDDIVDSFAPEIHRLDNETDNIEDSVFVARTDDMHVFLRQIGLCRKNVMGLMKLLGGKADVLRGFTKRCNENYNVTPRMDIGLYLGDIQDHVVTMMSNLGHFEKILSRSHSNYLAQLSIDNITQGNQSNKVLSKITLLASILVPLNLVCGMFGMNVMVPWRDSDSLGPFFGILGVLVLFVVVCLAFAKRMRYI